MASMVHAVSFLLLTFIVHLLVNCDGRAVRDISTNRGARSGEENITGYIDVSENRTARNKALEHFEKIEKKICSAPVPTLHPVDNIYSIPDGIYKPHCVELFRCNQDAGCCKDDSETCGPKEIETVHLHVTVAKIHETKIWLMSFENHTKCECKPVPYVVDLR